MTVRKKGLGRGLDSLLGIPSAAPEGRAAEALRHLDIDLIERGQFQPRVDMQPEALQELADSIRAQGIVQPIVVRPLQHGARFEIVAGERRWRAAQQAGLHQIPALVRELDDRAAMTVALIENLQRAQLNPIEEARGLARLIDEFEMTHQAVAEAIGRSRVAVTNLLRLLELAPAVREHVERGELEMGHARALAGLPADQQLAVARRIIAGGLSVRQAERLARAAKASGSGGSRERAPRPDPNVESLARDLSERLGAPVAIKHSKQGRGAVTIRYHSLDELDGILKRIG